MFQFPGFAFVPYVFRHKYLQMISASPTPALHSAPIRPVPSRAGRNEPQASPAGCVLELQISKVGFPIRKFSDQSLFAAPRNLSQRTTSFIASQRQGIHRILLRHLIALIIDVHPYAPRQKVIQTFRFPGPIDRYIKTSFASNISGNVRSARSLTGACHTRSDNGEP